MVKYAIIFNLLIMLSPYVLYGVSSKYSTIREFSVNDDLPHTDANDIIQDRYGFMWIATYGGLCKYDGYRATVYRTDNSNLSSNRILSLYEASDSSIYVGTESGGLNIFNPKTEQFHHSADMSTSIYQGVDNVIYHIFEADNHDVWVCIHNGIAKVKSDLNNIEFESYYFNEEANIIVNDGYCISSNEFLITTNKGVFIFDCSTKKFDKILDINASSIAAIDKSAIYIATNAGVVIYKIQERSLRYINRTKMVRTLLVDDFGNLWFGTYDDGLFVVKRAYLQSTQGEVPFEKIEQCTSKSISSLYADPSGVLWVGTIGGGVNMLNLMDKPIELYNKNRGLSDNRVITMIEAKSGLLWISTHAGGVEILNRDTGDITHLNMRGLDYTTKIKISSFYEDCNGAMWVGTWDDGIYLIPKYQVDNILSYKNITLRNITPEKYRASTYKIISDRDGDIWISTINGVLRYVPAKDDYYCGLWHHFKCDVMNTNSLLSNFVTDIYPETNTRLKTVWIGTRNGLNRVVFDDKIYGNIIIESHLKGEFISVIHGDSEENLWISSLGKGLYKVTSNRDDDHRETEFSLYDNKRCKFVNNEFESIIEDNKNNLWIGGYGISKFNPKTEEVVNYTKKDGLQSNSFKIWVCAKLKDGYVAFGGVNGFNIFHPDSLNHNPVAPRVCFTRLSIFNKSIEVGDKIDAQIILSEPISSTKQIKLGHHDNSFAINFAALHYVAPHYNRYRYRLEGLDKEWSYTSGYNPHCRYTNLSHGNYTLTVYGANSDEVWSEIPAQLQITIQRPFYLSYIAYMLYALCICAMLWWFRYSALKKSKQRHMLEMERSLRIEHQNNNEANLRFFTNIAHEIKTPLSLISVPVEDLLMSPSIGQSTRKKLSVVESNIKQLKKLVSQILELRRYENNMVALKVVKIDIYILLNETIQLFYPLADKRDITLFYNPKQEFCGVYVDKNNIDKVFVNLLSNAFKFTPDGGEIKIRVDKDDQWLNVTIRDSGIGIDKDECEHIFERFYRGDQSQYYVGTGIGLALVKNIIELHKGEVLVESEKGVGSKFSVRLRLGSDHFDANDIDHNYSNSDDLSHYEIIDKVLINDKADAKLDELIAKEELILVVDDNEELRGYVATLFEHKYKVITASNGMEAYEYAIAEQPDLILTDVVMPQMTGIELCSRVKSNSATSHIPVVLLTARDIDTYKMEGYNAGADGYITKPFSIELLFSVVNNILLRRNNMRQLFQTQIKLEPSEITVTTFDEKFLHKCIEAVEQNMADYNFGVAELCKYVNVSRPQLYRKIKSITGLSAVAFIRSIRLKRAAQILAVDSSSVSEVMYSVGITNLSYFSKLFKAEFGYLPKDFASKNKNRDVELI